MVGSQLTTKIYIEGLEFQFAIIAPIAHHRFLEILARFMASELPWWLRQ